ncbi:MAG: MFS transporter [Acholeplasma sp.]|nr:MAG: MFS transporter [Acholeplasma sp.]
MITYHENEVPMFKLKGLTKKERSWVLYDIANSAYILTIVTVLFPIYYQSVTASVANRTQIFAFVTAGIALTDALLSPIIGALSNYRGNKKKFFKIFLTLGLVGGLALIIPGLEIVSLLVFFVISSIGYNISIVVYDAFLMDVTDESRMDKVSSYGYAWGYIGSMIPFAVAIIPYALVVFEVLPTSYEFITVAFAFFVALLWWAIYSIPLLKDVEQTYIIERPKRPLLDGLSSLRKTFTDIKSYRFIFIFMLAYLFYIDVVNTVIRLATTIGTELGVGVSVLLGVVVLVQLIAFPSAILYGKMAEKLGGKFMIFYGILIYAITIVVTYFINEDTAWLMWVVGVLVGSAQGGIQSISRSYFAKMLPIEKANEFFGFFSVFGKFSGIVSPFLLAIAIGSWGTNQAVLILLLPLGLSAILLSFVKGGKPKLESK